jgi:hypothetical protein
MAHRLTSSAAGSGRGSTWLRHRRTASPGPARFVLCPTTQGPTQEYRQTRVRVWAAEDRNGTRSGGSANTDHSPAASATVMAQDAVERFGELPGHPQPIRLTAEITTRRSSTNSVTRRFLEDSMHDHEYSFVLAPPELALWLSTTSSNRLIRCSALTKRVRGVDLD